jgi:predicted ATPase
MKISKIRIRGFQQFEDFELDLTHPETGETLERVCLIGPNGTGKSTLLGLVAQLLQNFERQPPLNQQGQIGFSSFPSAPSNASLVVEFRNADDTLIFQVSNQGLFCYDPAIESEADWQDHWNDQSISRERYYRSGWPVERFTGSEDVLICEPSDGSLRLYNDPPQAPLNEALQFFKSFPVFHLVSVEAANKFWAILTYLLKKRESDYLQFIDRSENQAQPIGRLKDEFASRNPEILREIADLWDRILGKVGLMFDVEGAAIPVQLTDSLQAHMKSKNTGQNLTYSRLSSGIRNYIFKLGYIKTLYFNRQIRRGFLLIDEPENCLYPDLLYDLMDDYWSIIQNTQSFVSTHSPIIAAQFEPYERFHLDFDDRGYVTATRGVSPAGDDPNDLLYRDFRVRSIYGKKGLEKWERFRQLRQLIRDTNDPDAKETLMAEYSKIANDYNFPVPR